MRFSKRTMLVVLANIQKPTAKSFQNKKRDKSESIKLEY